MGMCNEMRAHLETVILPFWECLLDARGGYIGFVDCDLHKDAEAERGCILNSRILWFFSTGLRVLGDGRLRRYADHAYDALLRMEDKAHGGVYWSVGAGFAPLDQTKHTYCQAFAIYGLAAYARATGSEEAYQAAMRLYDVIEGKCRDREGYLEAFRADFSPESNEKLSENGVSATRTMNTLLHVMEAYAELYRVHGDAKVRKSLYEQFGIWEKHIWNGRLDRQEVFFDRDYNSLIDLTSFGHDIETSWLLDRALDTLNDPELTGRIRPKLLRLAKAVVDAAVSENGTDNECERGKVDHTRIWWVQAESLLGCLNAWKHTGGEEYLAGAKNQWRYILAHVWDRREGGEWFWSVAPDGTPSRKPIVEPWKCPYHNGRMILETIAGGEYENL